MKKAKVFSSIVLVCALFMVMSPFALARASSQIDIYSMDVTATGNGKIAIMFSVTGAGLMNRLGAESIDIYESGASGWEPADSFDADDLGMTASNAFKYGNTKYFYGKAGKEYKIVVTIFAEDKNGDSDSRSKTFYVTAR